MPQLHAATHRPRMLVAFRSMRSQGSQILPTKGQLLPQVSSSYSSTIAQIMGLALACKWLVSTLLEGEKLCEFLVPCAHTRVRNSARVTVVHMKGLNIVLSESHPCPQVHSGDEAGPWGSGQGGGERGDRKAADHVCERMVPEMLGPLQVLVSSSLLACCVPHCNHGSVILKIDKCARGLQLPVPECLHKAQSSHYARSTIVTAPCNVLVRSLLAIRRSHPAQVIYQADSTPKVCMCCLLT